MEGEAKARKELLALMVKEPQIDWRKLSAIKNKTLVIAGTDDVIRESHRRRDREVTGCMIY